MRKNDLEVRLIDYTVRVIQIAENLKKSYTGVHLSGQLIRSSTSAAPNYGDAQSAESRKDFLHKLKIILKELRETNVTLKIIDKTKIYKDPLEVIWALKETDELISIFVKSVETATKNAGLMSQ